jgi:hypothetical protein
MKPKKRAFSDALESDALGSDVLGSDALEKVLIKNRVTDGRE